MATAADRDPVLAALPAETRDRVERALQAYKTEASPAKAENLWPAIPLPGEKVIAPPLPRQPPRKRPGAGYCNGSQPDGWTARCIAQSRRPPRPPPKPPPTLNPPPCCPPPVFLEGVAATFKFRFRFLSADLFSVTGACGGLALGAAVATRKLFAAAAIAA